MATPWQANKGLMCDEVTGEGVSWVQTGDALDNSIWPSAMPSCKVQSQPLPADEPYALQYILPALCLAPR